MAFSVVMFFSVHRELMCAFLAAVLASDGVSSTVGGLQTQMGMWPHFP